MLSRKVGEDELKEGDFAAYLASSSGDEDDEDGEQEQEGEDEEQQQPAGSGPGLADAGAEADSEEDAQQQQRAKGSKQSKKQRLKGAAAGQDDAAALRARWVGGGCAARLEAAYVRGHGLQQPGLARRLQRMTVG